MKYLINLTKKTMKTAKITVPDNIPFGDVQAWAEQNPEDLFNVDACQEEVEWDGVIDLVAGKKTTVLVQEFSDDGDDYEMDAVYPQSN